MGWENTQWPVQSPPASRWLALRLDEITRQSWAPGMGKPGADQTI